MTVRVCMCLRVEVCIFSILARGTLLCSVFFLLCDLSYMRVFLVLVCYEEYVILRGVVSACVSLFSFTACVLAIGQWFPPHPLLHRNIGLCQAPSSRSASPFLVTFLFSLTSCILTLSVRHSHSQPFFPFFFYQTHSTFLPPLLFPSHRPSSILSSYHLALVLALSERSRSLYRPVSTRPHAFPTVF